MSSINFEQFVAPIALTMFMTALSLLVPGATEFRGTWRPPAAAARPPAVSGGDDRLVVPEAAPIPGAEGGPAVPSAATAATSPVSPALARQARGKRPRTRPSAVATAAKLPAVQVPQLLPPVDGELIRGFEAPASPFGPGHRGVDIGAPPGAAVTAPASGRVRFAGMVGGVGWVTIEVAAGATVTVGPIAGFRVRAGDDVGAESILGEVAAGHGGGVHLGLRIHGAYVDPQPHLARLGLARLEFLAASPSNSSAQRPSRAQSRPASRAPSRAPNRAPSRRPSDAPGAGQPRPRPSRRPRRGTATVGTRPQAPTRGAGDIVHQVTWVRRGPASTPIPQVPPPSRSSAPSGDGSSPEA
jgi:murein DD-endopeptidase MepM/ murein hydrolase activator NlpD